MRPNRIRSFEAFVLRPLWVGLIAGGIYSALNGRWFWVGGCLIGCIYLGAVGAKLHPFQSAADLAKGPLTNPVATVETESLSPAEVTWLISFASTKVAFLVGVIVGIWLISEARWRWYLALPLAFVVIVAASVALKFAFDAVRVPGEA